MPTPMLILAAAFVVVIMMALLLLTSGPQKSQEVASRLQRSGGDDVGPVSLKREGADVTPTMFRQTGTGFKYWLKAPEWFHQRFFPQLVRAGYHRPDHVNAYFTLTLVSVAVFGTVSIFLTDLMPINDELKRVWYLMGPAIGYYFPTMLLTRMIKARQRQIIESLPDALDLMVICLEVGIGIEQAMVRVGEELVNRKQPLGHELVLTSLQIDAGRPRNEALRAFSLRCDTQEVKSLVTMLIQTERLGTGVAQALRTASETLRVRRMQKAEAEAAKTSVKMIFPLVLFMLPATFVVLLGPSFLDFKAGFAGMKGK